MDERMISALFDMIWSIVKLGGFIWLIVYLIKEMKAYYKKQLKMMENIEEIKQLLKNSTDRPEP